MEHREKKKRREREGGREGGEMEKEDGDAI